MFVVGTDRNLYRFVGGAWAAAPPHPLAGRIMQVAVGNAQSVWTLGTGGEIHALTPAGFQPVVGALSSIAISGSGRVVGCNASGQARAARAAWRAWLSAEARLPHARAGCARRHVLAPRAAPPPPPHRALLRAARSTPSTASATRGP